MGRGWVAVAAGSLAMVLAACGGGAYDVDDAAVDWQSAFVDPLEAHGLRPEGERYRAFATTCPSEESTLWHIESTLSFETGTDRDAVADALETAGVWIPRRDRDRAVWAVQQERGEPGSWDGALSLEDGGVALSLTNNDVQDVVTSLGRWGEAIDERHCD